MWTSAEQLRNLAEKSVPKAEHTGHPGIKSKMGARKICTHSVQPAERFFPKWEQEYLSAIQREERTVSASANQVQSESVTQLHKTLEQESRELAELQKNLQFWASFYVDDGTHFDEVKLSVYAYGSGACLECRRNPPHYHELRYYAFTRKCYVIGTPGRTDQPDLHSALQTVVSFARQGKPIMDTLLVNTGSEFLSTKSDLYILTKKILAEALCEPEASLLPDEPEAVRQSMLRQRLLAALSSGTIEWNQRPQAERVLVDWNDTTLPGAALPEADLSGLNFTGSNFERADLRKANFSGANCSRARFNEANLEDSILDGLQAEHADFSSANMKGAKLQKSNLSGCKFIDTDLTKANLSYADLRGVDLETSTITKAQFKSAIYNEQTKLPPSFDQFAKLKWKGSGPDPCKLARKQAVLSNTESVDFAGFVKMLNEHFDKERLKKALSMLKKEKFELFSEVSDGALVGVVKSQTADELIYSCQLQADGTFSCCTQNLNSCGGLRGALCKHLLVLVIGLAQSKQMDPTQALRWVLASLMEEKPKLDRDRMTEVFLKYQGAQSGEIDWRPTETVPEDYYAF